MAKLDFPSSPNDGQVYSAPNGVNYTWDATKGVWTAKSAETLALTSSGYISGTSEAGKTLAYAVGRATGGLPPYSYTWEWRKFSDDSVLQVGGAAYLIPGSLVGDNVYVNLTITDSLLDTVNGSTVRHPADGTISFGPFINSVFLPAGAPNASPPEVSTSTLHGTGTCSSWEDGFTNLYSTGDILFSVNGGSYGIGPTSISNGDTVDVIWDTAAVAAAGNNDVLTGTLTNGTYSNSYTLTVTRGTVTGLAEFADLVDQPLSTVVTSDVVTPGGFNVPVTLSFAGSASPLTSLGVSVSGGGFSASPQTVNPGDTLELQGTTGGAYSTTYGVDITMGSPPATDTWQVTTPDLVPTISQPSITSPANGTTSINPALLSPGGIELVGSTYTPLNGAGAQTSSEWEVTSDSPGGTPISGSPFTVSTAPFETIDVPQASLSTSSNYFARVRYASATTTSEFSAWSSFSTASSFEIPPGTAMYGGYFGGQINDGGTIYNLIVAPVNRGQYGGLNPTDGLQWKTTATDDDPQGASQVYGQPMTVYGASQGGIYPAFNWIVNDSSGPNAGVYDATNTTGTGIGGYNDWYMPAYYELMIVLFTLKPFTNDNYVGTVVGAPAPNGSNPYSVDPYTPNTPFTATWPAQTTSDTFKEGGSEAFSSRQYWSASDSPVNTTNAQYIIPSGIFGSWQGGNKTTFGPPLPITRAIRRVLA